MEYQSKSVEEFTKWKSDSWNEVLTLACWRLEMETMMKLGIWMRWRITMENWSVFLEDKSKCSFEFCCHRSRTCRCDSDGVWDYFLPGSFLRNHGQSVMDLWTLIVKNTAKYSQVMDVEVRIIHWDYGASGRMIVTVLSLRIMNLVCILYKWNGERSIIKTLPCTNALTFHA